MHHLGAAAGRDLAGGHQEVGLVELAPCLVARAEAGLEGRVLGRHQCRHPVLVGHAEPAAGRLQALHALFVDMRPG